MSDISEKLGKPDWLRVKSPGAGGFEETMNIIRKNNVHTVCEEALCPNIGECWKHKTATFLIMGDTCTRNCGFCGVKTGCPAPLDPAEPMNIANAVRELGIKYAVITSVTRDDLKDGGAEHFASVICAIKQEAPEAKIEILTPDFQGTVKLIKIVAAAAPDVFGHNIEIIKRFHNKVKKPPADYDISIKFLRDVKKYFPNMITKTGLIVGVGEKKEEVFELIDHMVTAKVDILTIGQYLTPSADHYPVMRYVTPEEFEEYKTIGEAKGIKSVLAGPLVRSSYKAGEVFNGICRLRV